MKRIIDIPDDYFSLISEYGVQSYIAVADKAIRDSEPYNEAEVWNKSNELLEKRLSYLGRPKGRWVIGGNGTTKYYCCSECGSAGDIQDKFCRECGTDMRQVEQAKMTRGANV